MEPIVKYRGGKSKEIPRFLKYVPEQFDNYLEPFVGGGALFFYLEPKKSIINDINTSLITMYLDVKNNYERMRYELNSIQMIYEENRRAFENLKRQHPDERVLDKNEDLYYTLRKMYNKEIPTEYCYGSLYYFINKTAYSGMIRFNKEGLFNVPYGRYANFNTQLLTNEHSELLKNATILNEDYSKIFSMASKNDFMFLDPPYDCIFSDYGNAEITGDFDEKEHIRLADDYKKLNCKALMVIGKTKLTEELYEGYIVDEYSKSYAVNIRNRFKSEAVHLVVKNY